MKNWKQTILTGAILILGCVSVVLIYRKWKAPGEIMTDTKKMVGPENAPVEMVVYSDFQCPACRAALVPIRKLEHEFPNELRMQFKHFPLEHNHKWALLAAQFAECAGNQGKFWPYHNKLYDGQPEWSKMTDSEEVAKLFVRYARSVDLNIKDLGLCVTDERVTRKIRDERDQGERLGIRSTPTIFINGKMIVGGLELSEKGEAVIKAAIAAAKTPKPASDRIQKA